MCGRASPLRRVTPTPRSPIPWAPKTRSPHQSTELLKRVPHYEVTRTLLLPCLARRYQIAPPDVAELGRLLATRSIVLADVPPISPTARDPADDRILALLPFLPFLSMCDCILSDQTRDDNHWDATGRKRRALGTTLPASVFTYPKPAANRVRPERRPQHLLRPGRFHWGKAPARQVLAALG